MQSADLRPEYSHDCEWVYTYCMCLTSLSLYQGLEAIDALYRQCARVQGTAHYPLLLSLLYLSITPHTQLATPTSHIHQFVSFPSSFLRQWLFHGWLDEGEEFGIHSNHAALQCRGQHTVTHPHTLTPSHRSPLLERWIHSQ